MYWASSFTASGAGFRRPRFSIARSAMALRSGDWVSARSNRITGTRAFTQCAAICAPMTPAPSTATFLIATCFMSLSPLESEKLRLELHQVLGTRTGGADMVSGLRQQALEVEARGGELGTVERIGVGGADPVQRDPCHPGPEIREHQVPDHAQVAHGRG